MHILAGETQVTITSHIVNRHDNKRGLVLTIKTTTDNISLADADALCTTIKENSLDILVYNDNSELVRTLRGFYHNCICSKDTDGVITVEITNESENTFQIGLLKDENNALKGTVALQENEIAILAEENAASIEFEAELLYELSLMQLGLL